MASKDNIKFRSIAELKDPALTEKLSHDEFAEKLPIDDFLGDDKAMFDVKTSRRDFLKFLGFSGAAVTLAACESPVRKAVPYVVKPQGITPGVPTYYSTTIFDGSDLSSVLVKTREGRPIKIDSNPSAQYFGDSSARIQASVLSLYDSTKLNNPKLNGANVEWSAIDIYVMKGLNEAKAENKKIAILTPSLPSPSTKKLIEEFKAVYPTAEQIIFDTYSYSPALDASEEIFGKRVLPMYDLEKAELVVSFGADFLNSWNAGQLEKSYAKARAPKETMLKHIQVESNLSFTGANADMRIPMKPSMVLKTLAEVYAVVSGGSSSNAEANKIAEELKTKAGKAVVFAEGNKDAYVLAHLINQKLNSEALVKDKAILTKEANDTKFNDFVNQLGAGEYHVVINFNTNLVYSHAEGAKVKSALAKVPYTIALSEYEDETSSDFKAIGPVPHALESWGDLTPATGVYLLSQPTIQNIFDSRQFQDSLLYWTKAGANTPLEEGQTLNNSGYTHTSMPEPQTNAYYNYLKKFFTETVGGKLGYSFNQALYNGYNEASETESIAYGAGDATTAVNNIKNIKEGSLELALYTKIGVGDGTQGNNPWLQELPDPVSKISWDNYLTISPADAEELGLHNDLNGRSQLNGSKASIKVNGVELSSLPVLVQVGQAKGSLGLALGYGKKGKASETGVNAYPVFKNNDVNQFDVALSKASGKHKFACTQTQSTLVGRYDIAREVSLEDFLNKEVEEWNEEAKINTYTGKKPLNKVDLWEGHVSNGHHFNLSIDLNACTGCSACVVACQAENNVPVVGKEEIRNTRDMYWLRIDRYYSSKKTITQKEEVTQGLEGISMYKELVEPHATNPDVIFQPVMCQHCNHAPCETVCPVAATSHGSQGQNQMAYNRCVGTRYCANNCPYKVRRFNWFNYAMNDKFDFNMNDDLGRMVLNPDVVVRSRGVMEKCSMCIQMTQTTIMEAKKEGRKIEDGEFQTACSKACGTGAMKFGDINAKDTEIVKLSEDKRKYVLLEEVGTKPNVFYHYKVRNRK